MAGQEGVTEALKTTDQMEWVCCDEIEQRKPQIQSRSVTDWEYLPLISQSDGGTVYGKTCALTDQECKSFIESVEFRGKLSDIEQEAQSTYEVATTALCILKKQEFYNPEKRRWLNANAAFT